VLEYPLDSLHPFAAFEGLEILRIQGAAHLADLAGLEPLSKLRERVLASPPEWDRSGRTIDVASYRPLAALAGIEKLVLIDVRPRDLDLSPIGTLRRLQELKIAGVREFALEQFAALAAALPNTTGQCLQPCSEIEGVGICKKCSGQMVKLTGTAPRARKRLRPACNAKPLQAHVARWDAAKAAAQRARAR
jgi:hypothetical protein